LLRRRRAITRAAIATFFIVACAAAPLAIPPAPPLGVSLREEVDAASNAFAFARVDDCVLPDFIANDAAGPRVIEDVAYGDDKKQKYDLALPDDDAATTRALVVIVHGGGWTSGGKRLFRPTIRMLATLGYAAASVGYRLAEDAARAFPIGLEDVRCAIRAVTSRVAARKTILLGASAGGHLAALAALAPDAPRWDGECADRRALKIDGAILYYAPLEIDHARDRYVPIMRQAVDEFLFGAKTYKDLDGAIDEDGSDYLARAHDATPRHLVAPGAPPMLLLNGGSDAIVPIADARDFSTALDAAHVPNLVVELPDQGHGFSVLGHKPAVKPASCTTLRFLEQISAQ